MNETHHYYLTSLSFGSIHPDSSTHGSLIMLLAYIICIYNFFHQPCFCKGFKPLLNVSLGKVSFSLKLNKSSAFNPIFPSLSEAVKVKLHWAHFIKEAQTLA